MTDVLWMPLNDRWTDGLWMPLNDRHLQVQNIKVKGRDNKQVSFLIFSKFKLCATFNLMGYASYIFKNVKSRKGI